MSRTLLHYIAPRLCLLSLLLLYATSALADEPSSKTAPVEEKATQKEKARLLFLEAEARYQAEDFPGARALYEAAYLTYRDPAFLYNLAQCYRREGDAATAAALFERYLEEEPKAESRAEILEAIAL